MHGFVCKILSDFSRFFRCFKVNFNLQKTSAEINSVYFPSLILLECFWLLGCCIQVRQSTPLLGSFLYNFISLLCLLVDRWRNYKYALFLFCSVLEVGCCSWIYRWHCRVGPVNCKRAGKLTQYISAYNRMRSSYIFE